MTAITGKVTNVVANDTAYGKMYNVEVDGKTYGAGKFPPKVSVGDYISFEADTSGKFFKMDNKTVKQVAKPADAGAGETARVAPAKAYNDDARQLSITRQASRNAAIEWIGELRAADALAFKKTATAEAKQEAMDALLEKYTDEFVAFATGGRKSPTAKVVPERVVEGDAPGTEYGD